MSASDDVFFAKSRNLTPEGRRANCVASNQARVSTAAETSGSTTQWHRIDDPMTQEQQEAIPPADPDLDSRTEPLWLEFRHRSLRRIVVSEGHYDYDSGTWAARLEAEKDGGHWGDVLPLAWAFIIEGERPWIGPIIPQWHYVKKGY